MTIQQRERSEVETETSLGERPRPFRALYEHWERNQWSVLDLDLETDAESFAALEPAPTSRG